MEEFQSYSPEEIILSNLDELFARSMQVGEQTLAHLCELATEIASGFTDPTAFLASLPDHRLPIPTKIFQSTDSAVRSFGYMRSTYERALLCMELRKKILISDHSWHEMFFPSGDNESDESSENRIAYQKNSYTDIAFQCFSNVLEEARVSYVSDFQAVCEAVYNGLSEYGILPIESSDDGRLGNFARLISRFDLKICATCDVRIDGSRVTRFALLRRNLTVLDAPSNLPHHFEGSCESDEYPNAEALLEAARICGLGIERADVKRRDNGDGEALHVTFLTDGGDLPAFLLYLAMEMPSFHTIGYYSNYTV